MKAAAHVDTSRESRVSEQNQDKQSRVDGARPQQTRPDVKPKIKVRKREHQPDEHQSATTSTIDSMSHQRDGAGNDSLDVPTFNVNNDTTHAAASSDTADSDVELVADKTHSTQSSPVKKRRKADARV